jgi:NMD protein affecting ribosome stability and mRNA decay
MAHNENALKRLKFRSNIMRSNKRYTTQTFTKRVDHEGGEHVGTKAPAEPAICRKCGAIYTGRRWKAWKPQNALDRHDLLKPETQTICPACKQIGEGVVGGYLSIDGTFLGSHRTEITSLISNEVRRAAEDNPLSKIMNWSDEPESVKIETTTEHLAQRLGHALEKAFDGKATYKFSHENKVTRVNWHRD